MGLFSKGPKIDPEEARENKVKMRRLFNQAVPDGDTYEILYATTGSTWKESRVLSDVRVYQFISLAFGYRESDFKIVTVPVNIQLTEFSEPDEILISDLKTIKYKGKKNGETLEISFPKAVRPFTIFGVSDTNKGSRSFVSSVNQPEEREKLKAFVEKCQTRLSGSV